MLEGLALVNRSVVIESQLQGIIVPLFVHNMLAFDDAATGLAPDFDK
jgi:hypothetical protein